VWWDGTVWQPVTARRRRPRSKWMVLTLAALAVLVLFAGAILLAALSAPAGSQHESDELGRDYCAYFPEDC
jgi:hypothetical protein